MSIQLSYTRLATYIVFVDPSKTILDGLVPTGIFFINSFVVPLITETVLSARLVTYIAFTRLSLAKYVDIAILSGLFPTGIFFINSFIVPLITETVLLKELTTYTVPPCLIAMALGYVPTVIFFIFLLVVRSITG